MRTRSLGTFAPLRPFAARSPQGWGFLRSSPTASFGKSFLAMTLRGASSTGSYTLRFSRQFSRLGHKLSRFLCWLRRCSFRFSTKPGSFRRKKR